MLQQSESFVPDCARPYNFVCTPLLSQLWRRPCSGVCRGMKRMAKLSLSSTGCCDRLLVCRMLSSVQPCRGHTVKRESRVTRMVFIITMAMCLPTQERGPQPKGWKNRLGTCRKKKEPSLVLCFLCFHNYSKSIWQTEKCVLI